MGGSAVNLTLHLLHHYILICGYLEEGTVWSKLTLERRSKAVVVK